MHSMQEQYVVDGAGNRTAVIVPAEQYQKMLEDLHDLAVVAKRREEKSIDIQTMKRRLHKDGLL